MAFSESIRLGQIPVSCGLCDKEKPIKWKCFDCDLLLCSHCKETVHLKVKTAKDHRILDIKEIGLHKEELNFANIPCQDHARQYTCLYCKTCDNLVCPTCVSKVHKKHDLIEIQEEYDTKIEKLKNGQKQIQRNRKQIVSQREELNQLLSVENYKYSQVKQDVLRHEKSVKAAVERYFKKLRHDLDQQFETVSNTIKTDLNSVLNLLQQSDVKSKEVQELVSLTNVSKFFTNVNNFEESSDIQMFNLEWSHCSIPNFIPGEINQSNIGMLKFVANSSHEPHIRLTMNIENQTELRTVTHVCSSTDGSFCISSGNFGLIQKVKIDGTKLNKLSSYNSKVYGMAITQSNDLLLCTEGSILQKTSSNFGDLTNSKYNISPLVPTAVHITKNNKIIVGGVNSDHPQQGRRVLIIMNQNGDHERVFEHDQHKKPLLSFPVSVTSTSNGNVHVVDQVSNDRGRVVVLEQGGDIINIYTGDNEINQVIRFIPGDIVTTPRDNVIVADTDTNTLHIMNNAGILMTCYKTCDIDIHYPFALAFSATGQLYIGCSTPKGCIVKYAKIYTVTISGC